MSEQFDFVLFGGCGDLAYRKLIPALYRAFVEGKICSSCRIIPTCRKVEQQQAYIDTVTEKSIQYLTKEEFDQSAWEKFTQHIQPVVVNISEFGADWKALAKKLNEAPATVARVFYMAIPPGIFGACCENLAKAKAITDNSRVVVEKPLGYDAKSSNQINDLIAQYFPEQSIYRIDHYLGKETVQNLFALRFTNFIFEQLWDSKSIDHVQISISETVGLEGRAGFYDEAGAMRDMVQNHLLQLLCLVAMESPNRICAQAIRAEKLKVLEALRPITGESVKTDTVRGQYVAGNQDGKLVPGYLEELAKPQSTTETFVALKVHIDNWRWARVPFYLRTGKRMKQRCAEIVIQFKDVSHKVFDDESGKLVGNRLVIRLQPEESIQMTMMSKNLETLDMQLQPATLNLNFSDTFKFKKSDAYKRLILDAAVGNPSLFIHRDEVACAWAWVDPIIEQWASSKVAPHLYRSGSWGPDESNELIEADNRQWYNAGDTE